MDKLNENVGEVFPRMPATLRIIIDGNSTVMPRLWREVVVELVSA
jgi:hypothetical protein